MNRIYKVIWSKTKHCYVVVSELAKRHTKGGSAGGCRMMTTRVLGTLLLGAYLVGGYSLPSAWADGDPNEAEVAAGDKIAGGSNVTVSKNENTITISATDTTYTAGDGLQLLDGTTFSVKADGNTIAVGSNGIKVNADGTIASGDTGIVTGGAVYDVTQPLIEKIGGITRDGMKTTIEQGFTVQTNFSSGSSNGYMNVYWGQDTLANGENATAWGKSTVARSPRSTAWGNEATAKGDQATAFGSRTTAYGVNSTAWGADTVAFSHQATAFGENTTAGGQRATAWGHKTTAGGDSSTAYGKETSALMEGATAWGNNTKAGRWTYTDENGVVHDALVIEPDTDVNNGSEMYEIVDAVTGEQITNGKNDYIAAYDWLAEHGTMNGVYSTAWGNGTQAAGDYSTAFGNYTKTAAVTSLKYNGTEAKIGTEMVLLFDKDGNPEIEENPDTHETRQKDALKYIIVDAANPDNKLYESYFDTEDAAMKYLVQNGTITGGYGATAFGLLSEAKGAHSTAFGVQTVAEGTGATAWGNSTTASGKGATASGYGTKAEGDYSTAFGNNTTTAAVTSLKYRDPDNNDWTEAKIITKNTATGLKYVIVEAADPNKELYFSYFDTEEAAMNEIAREGKITGGYGATAFGLLSEAKGAHSTAFGVETVAEGTGATAWGRKAKATGDYSTAWGFNTEAINDKSTAFGDNTIAGGKIATAWGNKTAAGGRTSTAFGSETVALTEGATAWGNNTKAGKWTYAGHDVFIKKEGDGGYHIIDEYGNSGSNGLPGQIFVSYDAAYKELSTNGTVQGVYATAWGNGTKAEGDYSTAFGVGTVASGSGATAWGNGAQATGDYSTAIGAVGVNSSSGADSAVNTNTEAQADYSVAVLGGITRKQDDINAINSVALGGAYDASRPDSDYFKPSLTNAPYSIALLGGETASTATNSLAVGLGSVTKGANSVAMLGGVTEEDATNSIALGGVVDASGDFVSSTANGDYSVAMLGGMTDEHATNSIAIGHGKVPTDGNLVRSLAYAEDSLAVLGGMAGNHGTNSIALGGALDGDGAFVSSTTYGPNSVAMLGGMVGSPATGNELPQPKNALAIGLDSVAGGSNSIAIGSGGKDSGGDIVGSTANAENSLAVLGGTTESAAMYSLALGGATYGTEGIFVSSVAEGKSSLAVLGGTTKEPAINSLALGSAQEEDGNLVASETTAENSIAVLGGTTASGATNSIALGGAVDADGDYVRSETKGKNSIAVLGGTTDTNATNALAIGEGATTTLSDSIALGSGAVADRAKYDESNNKYTAYLGDETGETKKDFAWRSTANAIAIGSDDSSNPVTRQIIGVAAGTEDTDAVNVAQLKAATFDMQGITRTETGTPGATGYVATTTIENNLSVSSDGKVKWGNETKASGEYSTAGGYATQAMGRNATAFGFDTEANGKYATAFGSSSIAAGDNSTAFGSNTKAGKLTYKIEDGSDIEAKIVEYTTDEGNRRYKIVNLLNEDDVLSNNIGKGYTSYEAALSNNRLTKQGDYSTAFGISTEASGNYSTAFGISTVANGQYATAFGENTKAKGESSTAFGSSTEANGRYATAFGYSTKANSYNATAFGYGSIADGSYSTAFGLSTTAKGVSSTAFGSGTTASGVYSTAFGEGTLADGSHSTAWGDYTQALSHKSTAFGDHTTAGHDNATAWGYETTAGDRTTTAFGNNTAALMEGATAWGHNTKAGKWTVKDDTGIVHDLIIETYIDNNPAEGKRELWGVKYAENKGTDDVFIGGQTSYTSAYTALERSASTDPNVTMQGNYATAWGNGTEAEGDYSTAFGNFTKTAAVTSFKYNGTEAKVVSEVVKVKDANGNPVTITDPGNTESGETIYETEIKYTIVNANDPEKKLSDTYFDSEDAAMNEIVQNGTITGGYGATAFGLLTEAKGAHSTAFGVRTTAGGIGATAWGNGTQATGDYSTAFGNGSVANASNSLAALGGTTAEDAVNSLAVGLGAQTTLPDSIALGSGAVADRAKYDETNYTAYLGDDTGTTKTGSAWRATANAIAIGHIDTTDDTKSVTRQIIGVAAGTEDTDAVNVAQLKAATFDMQGITRTETGTPGEAGYVATTTIENNLSVSSDGKVKWGNGTKAEGDYSTAGGFYTKANGDYATAFGNAAKANGQYSTAFGSSSIAAGDYSTAFGRSTEAKGYNSTAFGNSTQANGQDATAFGSSSIAVGDYSTAFGSYTQAGKLTYKNENGSETEAKIVEYTTAAGNKKYKIVSKDGLTLLSNNNGAGFYYSEALNDSNLTKQGDYSTAFGSSTIALGDFSTAFGSNTKATGDNSTAFGSSTKATGSSSTAFGSITEANGPSGTAFGSSTMANGQHSTAFGSSSIAAGYISTAFGSNTQAGKLTYKKDVSDIEAKIVEYTTAAGNKKYKIVSLRNENDVLSDNNGAGFDMYESALYYLTRQGDYSTAFGSSTKALGDYSTAWGFSAQANGDYSTAFGSSTEASGTGATAWGSSTKALGTYSTAFGNGSVANAYNSLAALGGTTGEKATNSVAIGTGATVGGAYDSENQQTEGANAFAFGNGAQATLSDSVALGSGAVANRAKYNASNNAYKAYLNEDDNNQKTDPAWRATHNAIAVGASATDSDTATVTRQITGVAAGTYDTDAVNVAQLKAASTALTFGGLKFGANANADTAATSAVVTNALGSTVNVVGTEAVSGHTYSTDNITTEILQDSDGNSTITVKLDENPSFSSVIVGDTTVGDGTVTLGSNTELTTDSLKVGGKTYISSEGLNANGKITGVVAGEADTDAVNVGQLNTATSGIKGITRSEDATDGYTTTIEGKLSVSSNGAFSISGDKFTVDSDGAISAASGKFSVNSSGGLTIGSETQNTSVSDTGVTIKDGPSVTTSGIDAGGKKITNLGQGVADNDAVNVQQLRSYVTTAVQTGGSFGAGQGLVVNEVTNGSLLEVNAGEGLGFASDGSLKVNAGDIAENDAGFVTGGTVYSALQAYQPEGEVAAGNAKAVSGATVFSALSAYAKSDGATLTGTTISSGSIADDVNLVGVDSSITVGSLKSSVATNTSAITALNETINDGSDGLVVKVTALEDTVGNAERGLVKKVDDNTAAIGTINTSITGINDSITSLSSGKANIDLDNITDNGKATMRSLAKESVKVVAGTNTTVTKGADGNADTYAVDVVANGSVDSGDTGLVAGGTVFNALSAYAKAEGATLTNATLSSATISSGSIADGVTIGSSGVTVGALKSNVDTNTSDISALKATLNDSSTGLVKKVNDNASAIQTNATNIAANKTAIDKNAGDITNLNTKVSANETAIQTNATNIAANKTAIEKNASDIATNKASIQTNATNIAANKTAIAKNTSDIATNKASIQTNATNIAANKTAIAKNTSDIAANKASIQTNATNIEANKTAIEKNAGDITTLGTKVTANETAIKKNASDITSLSTKITDNETALSKKADKANTLKGYGIEDAYTKEDTDTLLNKKADKTELEKVKATADSNKKALDALGDVQELTKDAETVKKIANDVETVVKEQDGVVAEEGQKADELVKGSTVYDYLNKGQNGDGSLVLGAESTSITMGKGSEATGDESIAMGFDNQVNGNQNVTIGTKHTVKGDSNIVIGDPDNITGNKNAALANDTNINGSRNGAFGNNITINGDDTFVIGNNVTANESNAVVLGNGSTAEKDAVSVGSKDGERQIKHVKAGTDPTDAATVGQVQEVAQGAYNNAVNLSNSINNLDSRLNKVGAGAAALAALHPIDTDDKFTMGLGYGNYRSANAMAMGMFYRPTEKIMISVGGAFGNGENMVNAGISFALDKGKGFGTSKAVMAKNIKALSAENAAIKEENAGMKKQLDAQGNEIAALKAALARLEAKIGK